MNHAQNHHGQCRGIHSSLAICLGWLLMSSISMLVIAAEPTPFGAAFPKLDGHATGEWWKSEKPPLLVPRNEVVAFALYTCDASVLKLTAQLYPLLPEEPRTVILEFQREGRWQAEAEAPVHELGWSAHFRIAPWDASKDVPYRVRLGEQSVFTGTIRRDPTDKEEIVVGTLSCNSSRTPGPRPTIVENLKRIDPDLLFFAGDQSYHHTQHTFGWLEFGVQFRDVLRDRPVVTIPDDHDVGQANIWGEGGKQAKTPQGPAGGFFYPAKYVNMVQRCQTWHLPDPHDATPIDRGITVYYTRLRVGGIDFAILEDRKFKSGPEGKIPPMGPRPDHINDPNYDREAVDVPGLKLLGDRQLKFLDAWAQDWQDAEIKCVLSQTAFCGAVHLHGTRNNRLLADLDCNGWPQTGRNKALRAIRRGWATHLCGDQHLAVVVQHGIDAHRDGPFAFTSPAIVNTIYGRWWHPEDERPGTQPRTDAALPWTGDYTDGLGNRITMLAYANPANVRDEQQRGDGFGVARFNKRDRRVTFECWPRFARVDQGEGAQYPGWPITVNIADNDGRSVTGTLPLIKVTGAERPVVQVVHEPTGEVLYTVRWPDASPELPVYSADSHLVRIGHDRPDEQDAVTLQGLRVGQSESLEARLP